MANIKFSIIIPVYNSENVLDECVGSILSQTYTNFEIILVHDGSTDNSASVCDSLAKRDERIVVVHKENGGTSSARNAGLDKASGDYITFTDNDDFWNNENALKDIASQLDDSGADLLLHENYILWLDTNKMISPTTSCKRANIVGKSPSQALSSILAGNLFSLYCVWSKVIRADLIRENNIRFPEGMRNEDTCFCGDLLLKAQSYDFYEKPFYVYKKGHQGAQTSAGVKYSHLADLQKICIDFVSKSSKIQDEGLSSALLSFIAFPFSVWMGQSCMTSDKRIKDDRKEMKKYKYLLKNDIHPSVKKVKLACTLIGFRLTCKLLSIYIKKNNHLS